MPRPCAILRSVALLLTVGTTGLAQDSWSYTLKLAGGPTFGGLVGVLGRAGFQFGGDFEAAYRYTADSRIVVGLGYRAFPGDFENLSSIPYSYAATNVNPTVYESRVRKPEGNGFQLTGLYRSDLPRWNGAYWQAGLRIGANRFTQTDTGTQLVTDGRASTVSGNVIAVKTIAEIREKSSLSVGPMAGAGYQFLDFTLELNVWMASIDSPAQGKKNGLASELAFGFRF